MGRIIFSVLCIFAYCSLCDAAEVARYIVKVKSGGSANPFSRLMIRSANLQAFSAEARSGLSGVIRTQSYSELGLSVVEGSKEDIENALSGHPLVEYFEKEVYWKPNFSDPNSLPSSQDKAPWLSSQMGLEDDEPSENIAITGTKVVIAVVDTGTTVSHPFLEDAIYENTAETPNNGIDDDGNGYVDDVNGANVIDYSGNVNESVSDHGTHVAGLIKIVRDHAIAAGYAEARGVSILPVKFIGNNGLGSTSGAIQALDYALSRNAKVINASWGARGEGAFSRALYESLVELYNRNVITVVAAGNAESGVANNNDEVPYFPSSYNIPALISVASITPRFKWRSNVEVPDGVALSSFSNYGANSVDLAAVGSYRDADGEDSGVFSANSRYASAADYIRKRGTSMATPLVAGVAAVIRAIQPSLTNYEVKQIIIDTVNKSSAYAKTKSSGSLNAAAAFAKAEVATSKNLKPSIPSAEYYNQSALQNESSSGGGGGGCMSVQDIGSSGDGNGPFGGNSLMLFAISYFAFQWMRKFHKRVYKDLQRD